MTFPWWVLSTYGFGVIFFLGWNSFDLLGDFDKIAPSKSRSHRIAILVAGVVLGALIWPYAVVRWGYDAIGRHENDPDD